MSKKKRKAITLSELKSLLRYDRNSGNFFHLTSHGSALAGTVAGTSSHDGYHRIKVLGEYYRAHRLAWFYVKGYWPVNFIDHKNNNPLDNRFANLRECTALENAANCKKSRTNKSGFKGVSFRKDRQKWRARIKASGKHLNIGSFSCPTEAAYAYDRAAKLLHGDFAKTNESLGLIPFKGASE
jgi:hypothetical protein